MSSKSLIFILNLLLCSFVALNQGFAEGFHRKDAESSRAPKKRAKMRKVQRVSQVAIPVRLIWQVIRSEGEGAMMNTSAETFSSEAQLIQIGRWIWEFRTKDRSVFGSFLPSQEGLDGRLILERSQLLSLLNITPRWFGENLDGEGHDAESEDALQLPLQKAPFRQMETIYKGPEEELLLVKVSLTRR